MTTLEFILCCLLVLISAFMSASEIALFSLSRFQLRNLKDQVSSHTHRRIRKLLQDPGGLLISILFVNEVVNISLSTLITRSIAISSRGHSGLDHWLINFTLGTLITTPIVLFACEITPKTVGARANQLVASATAGGLNLIYDLLKPIRLLLTSVVRLVSRRKPKQDGTDSEERLLKESEFLLMVEEGHKEGAIHQSELDLIKNVFELDDTRVEEILTPLSQVQPIPSSTSVRSALALMRSQRYSRYPVIAPGNRRQVVGVLYTKDLLRAKLDPAMGDLPIAELMRKPLVVSPGMQLNALFRKFKQQKTHMAVVQKPGGDTLGVVTMTDVLESLFEDLLEAESEAEEEKA